MCPISHGQTKTTSTPSHAQSDDQLPPPPTIVPKTALSKAAFNLAATLLTPAILNHSLRVYHYAHHLAAKAAPQSPYLSNLNQDLLFTSCILHDIGTTETYDGTQRFEVCGADAAHSLLISHEVSAADAHDVWVAIALHTSPGIAERITELARLVRFAVLIDFGKRGLDADADADGDGDDDGETEKERVEGLWPRLGVEKVLGDAVVEQARRRPEKAPAASWPGILFRAHLAEPGWDGVNRAF